MKIVYCINSLKNPGGMERVLVDKANYFVEKFGYEITIITTDQEKKQIFYKLSSNVKQIELDINYYRDTNKFFLKRVISYLKKNRQHKICLEKILKEIKPDIVISTGCEERNFLPHINKEIKKIREYHFGKNYRKEFVKSFNKNFLYKIKALLDTYIEEKKSKKYDKVILLTKEDYENWRYKKNIEVIYNSISYISKKSSKCENKKVIAVGRLDGQKGFDLLINAWKNVNKKFPDWILEIYGDGIDKEKIKKQINALNLENIVCLKGITKNIDQKYLESSCFILSSRYEGFGMVLIEAMNFGLPLVSFSCPCGPKDIIKDGYNGYLARNGDTRDLAQKISLVLENDLKRKELGQNSKSEIKKYSQKKIYMEWKKVFQELLKEN